MPALTEAPRLADIIDSIEVVLGERDGVSLDAFAADRRKRWIVGHS